MKLSSDFKWENVPETEQNANQDNQTIVFDIPGGAYVMEIIKAEDVISAKGNSCVRLILDVADGEYAHFAENAEEKTGKDWSYKKLYLVYNDDENSKEMRRFSHFLNALEDSNRRFSAEKWKRKMNEKEFEGLVIGVVCDERLNEYNGKVSLRVEPNVFKICSAGDVEDGKHQKPKLLSEADKKKLEDNSPVNTAFGADEIPF